MQFVALKYIGVSPSMANKLINTISFAMKESEPLGKPAVEYQGTRKPANQRNSGHSFWRSPALAGLENVQSL